MCARQAGTCSDGLRGTIQSVIGSKREVAVAVTPVPDRSTTTLAPITVERTAGISDLYARATHRQWAVDDLDWSRSIDVDRLVATGNASVARSFLEVQRALRRSGSVASKWRTPEWTAFRQASLAWTLSQTLHGEQGAMIAAAKIARSSPSLEAKQFAATQLMDEARHVEAFSRYLDKVAFETMPVNAHLLSLLDLITESAEWDLAYLGMQIIVEGLALASFRALRSAIAEPLLEELLGRVINDEARHVAFGVLELREVYASLRQAELLMRQQFAFEGLVTVLKRLRQEDVWAAQGLSPAEVKVAVEATRPLRARMQADAIDMVRINCFRAGLIGADPDWLNQRLLMLHDEVDHGL